MISQTYVNPKCWVCGSTGFKVQVNRDLRVSSGIVCRAHEYVCTKHGKDPCPECDTSLKAQHETLVGAAKEES